MSPSNDHGLGSAPVAAKTVSHDYSDQFLQAMQVRRSTYTLTPETTISDDELKHILELVLDQAPSTFASFTTRLVVALKDEHYRLWDLITGVVKNITPPQNWEEHTKPRFDGFRNAYGTILFFEDPEQTENLQNRFPFLADKFPVWAQHTSAIHQFAVWTALTNKGLGANLQHYNPLIDDEVKGAYGVPQSWNLVGQLVFGKPSAGPAPKPTANKPMQERLQVFGA